jgi:hypothetical protein
VHLGSFFNYVDQIIIKYLPTPIDDICEEMRSYKEKFCIFLTFSVSATYLPQLFNVVKERPHLHLSSCRTAPIFHISPFPPFFPVNVFYTKPIQKGTTFFCNFNQLTWNFFATFRCLYRSAMKRD